MVGLRLGIFVSVIGACSSPSATTDVDPSVLRVSTSLGLEPISPSASRGTRNLLDLVYDYGGEHFSTLAGEGDRWRLTPKDGETPAELALKIRHERLVSSRAVDGLVEVTLSDGPPPTLDDFYVDVGPFEQASFTPQRLELHRRTPGGIAFIQVYSFTSEDEEWRRFLARDVDMNPRLSSAPLAYLREVPSVRVVEYRQRKPIALYFGLRSPTFGNPEVRRAVAAHLQRDAIARFATGNAANAIAARAFGTQSTVAASPVKLIFHEAALDQRRAMLVVEQQLVEMGFDVTVRALDLPALQKELDQGSFDGFLFNGDLESIWLPRFTTGHEMNVSKFSNPDYDAAIARGDNEMAINILEHDVPMTPLYNDVVAVAIDRRFCNVHPIVSYDYSFIAAIHPCAPGETE